MGETRTILTTLQAALANDNEFVNWCLVNLGTLPTIQVEVVDLERLDDADFPFIGFFDISQDAGIISPRLEFSIKLLAGVRNTSLTTTTLNGCELKSYAGRLDVEDLREMALAVLFRGGLGIKITTEGASVPNHYHPRYYSGAQLTIEKQK